MGLKRFLSGYDHRLLALLEDLGFISITHMVANNHVSITPVSGTQNSSSGLHAIHEHGT